MFRQASASGSTTGYTPVRVYGVMVLVACDGHSIHGSARNFFFTGAMDHVLAFAHINKSK